VDAVCQTKDLFFRNLSDPFFTVISPPICIFDEATSALDTITEASVKDALDRLGSDRTVLVIAHRLGTCFFRRDISFLSVNMLASLTHNH
jgi:ABC-type bacteriocin/lantibiotic exporter with double-glycine peptidase domain